MSTPYNSKRLLYQAPALSVNVIASMPSENTFKAQVELARAYLRAFQAISEVGAPVAVKASLDLLADTVADFHKFIPFFDNHPLFVETVSATYTAIDSYIAKNPTLNKPDGFPRITGMYTTAKNFTAANKRGTSFSFICLRCSLSMT
jgi:hypothetical protein